MNAQSVLEAVALYRDAAIVTRRAQVAPGTEASVRVGGLPLCLNPGSLRARVATSGQLRVLDVRAAFDVQLAAETDVPAEVKAVEEGRHAVAKLEQELARLDRDLALTTKLTPTFREPKKGAPPREAPVAAMIGLADFVDQRVAGLHTRRRALVARLDDARRELNMHTQRLAEASSATARTERAQVTRCAVVVLSEAPTAPTELLIDYEVPGTRWTPSYELRLAAGGASGALRMRAQIAQDTGEDWKGVKLSLSTAYLQRRADLPELRALKIGRTQPAPPRSGWREPPAGLDSLFEGLDGLGRHREEPPATPPVLAEQLRAPMKKSKPTGERAARSSDASMHLARVAEPAAVMAYPPPAPPPPAPSAAPKPAAMVSRARSGGAPMQPGGGGFNRAQSPRAKERAFDDEAAPMVDEFAELEGGYDQDEDTGAGVRQSLLDLAPVGGSAIPGWSLEESLFDYDRLMMVGFDGGDGRGRLRPAGAWEFAFVAGVSVQIEVVVGLIAIAEQRATHIHGLPLPANCTGVTSLDSFDYRFECAAPVDVPSVAAWTTVPVTRCDVGLTPEYVCVPSVESKVYRTLQIANTSPHALLPGPVDVMVGEEFLLTAQLPATAPGSSATRLGLGVEEAIKVSRKTQYRESTGGLLGGTTVLTHEIEIELNNRLSTPAKIDVRERVPIAEPNEKDIKIEEAQVQPPWEKADGLVEGRHVPGQRRWRLSVPPATKQVLHASYAVRIPSDRMLVGGNRRG